MTKYRKKPVVIEAERFESKKYSDSPFLANVVRDRANLSSAWANADALDGRYYIETLEGQMIVSEGDYVIKGVQGEFYPCKPEIFEQTYEKVDE